MIRLMWGRRKMPGYTWRVWAWAWLQGFGAIADGLVTVLTLGLVTTGFGLALSKRGARAYINELAKG